MTVPDSSSHSIEMNPDEPAGGGSAEIVLRYVAAVYLRPGTAGKSWKIPAPPDIRAAFVPSKASVELFMIETSPKELQAFDRAVVDASKPRSVPGSIVASVVASILVSPS